MDLVDQKVYMYLYLGTGWAAMTAMAILGLLAGR